MRSKKGTVSSTKQDRTLVVTVHRYENHPLYKKRFRISKNYHVHNPENKSFEVGDNVTIYECKPVSKLKRWTIVKPTENK